MVCFECPLVFIVVGSHLPFDSICRIATQLHSLKNKATKEMMACLSIDLFFIVMVAISPL
jgi:hypothetical protein